MPQFRPGWGKPKLNAIPARPPAPGCLCARRLAARLGLVLLARLVGAGEGRGVELRVGEGLEGQDALAPARRADAVRRARVQRQQQLRELLDDAPAAGAVLGLGRDVVRAAAALRDDGVEGLRVGARVAAMAYVDVAPSSEKVSMRTPSRRTAA